MKRQELSHLSVVMPANAGIHVFVRSRRDVDGRDKPGRNKGGIVSPASSPAAAVLDVRDLVEVRVDVLGQPIELLPFLAELGRAVGGFQELAALPLEVVDDAFSIEAAMKHDRDEARLARHESRPVLHHGERVGLLARLGLAASQGTQLIVPYYWDMNDATRAFAKRFQARHPKKLMPNDMHAGVYASVLHYLKAVDKAGGASDGRAVVAAMKAMPTDDPLFGKGSIRADGRKIHPMYLFQVKSPAESKGEWDYFKLVSTIPAEEAFRPLKDGGCPLVTN